MTIDFFGASWCKACKPQLEQWQISATKYGYTLNYIDVDLEPECAGEHGIKTVPTVYVNRELPVAIHGAIATREIDKICRGDM
jgi:thioredoxin-like negative regulator of GroEL